MNFKKFIKLNKVKDLLRSFNFLKVKKIKFLHLVFLLVSIFLIFFLFWRIERKKNNVEENNTLKDESLIDSESEMERKKENAKIEEIERKSEEETAYGELGDFWIEIDTENLKIKAPIVEGTSDKDLDQGVGHHVLTAFPNREKGNVVLSGHRWYPGDIPARTVFIDLDKLKVGEKIKLYYENEEFVYEITETKIIEDTEVSILDQTEKPTITIYTCTPKYPVNKPTKRLVFIGELVY